VTLKASVSSPATPQGGWNGHEARSREIEKKRGIEGKTQRKHYWVRLIRPQSRGLRASSDVSQVAAPHATTVRKIEEAGRPAVR